MFWLSVGKVQFTRSPEAGLPNTGAVITGAVSVLLVSVSVVALPTKVSVAIGRVSVPEPATVGASRVIDPLVSPATTMLDICALLLVL